MFFIALILFAITLISLVTFVMSSKSDTKGAAILAFFASLLFGVGFIVAASVSQVPTRNVGIVKQFSKQTGRTTGAGWVTHKPYESVDDWDASGQAYAHLGDRCIKVSIAAQRQACIPVQVEYRSSTGRAPENWAAYKEVDDMTRFETFVARRVEPQITAAMISTFASFDPLGGPAAAKPGEAVADAPAPDLNKTFRQPLIDAINVALGGGTLGTDGKVTVTVDDPKTAVVEEDPEADIIVTSVSFGAPTYDEKTQGQIDAYGQKVLEARTLAVDETNAETRRRIAGKSGLTPFQVACLAQAGTYAGLCGGAGSGSQVILPAK